MIYQGKAITVAGLESGIAQLNFDLSGSSVNKFDRPTLTELKEAIAAIDASTAKGLVCTSSKSNFIVGADINEFTNYFKLPEHELVQWCAETNRIFNALEDLPIPTVSAINGMALGGGLEFCLATDYRVAAENAVLGFPEVKLGICPGFGGTVRAPRVIGADNAIQWITTGMQVKARQALAEGAIDAIVAQDVLLEAAQDLVKQCIDGKFDYKKVRTQKQEPLKLNQRELEVAFETAKGVVSAQAGPHYPAPAAAVQAMHEAGTMARDEALKIEHRVFAKLARTTVAGNLVQLFLSDQWLKQKAKKAMANSRPISRSAVLGAGIMGGGIAYQSALKGTPIIMKDIAQDGLDLGMRESKKLLKKQLEKGRLSSDQFADALTSIDPVLEYSGFRGVDVIVEAVVENASVKEKVLAEVEDHIRDDAILTSNTSTISITHLSKSLKRPENFCGMHFFNPVPLMPLVEVIRGERSSDEAIATTVAYGQSLGKTPIVVRDCPGFLVNRVLFPYFGAFSQLIRDGADFRVVDRAMEQFGWPMGPAYLLDVVGIDTAVHAQAVMAEGFPDRMAYDFKTAIDVLAELKRFGQKSGSGFYHYEVDKRGRRQKVYKDEIVGVLKPVQTGSADIDENEVVERMMTAFCLEAVRCLEDDIISDPIEADMAMVLGLGFPTFRGGPLRYIDSMGTQEFCNVADKYEALGPLYHPTAKLREMAASSQKFYS